MLTKTNKTGENHIRKQALKRTLSERRAAKEAILKANNAMGNKQKSHSQQQLSTSKQNFFNLLAYKVTTSVHVENLSPDANSQHLRNLYSKFGEIVSVKINRQTKPSELQQTETLQQKDEYWITTFLNRYKMKSAESEEMEDKEGESLLNGVVTFSRVSDAQAAIRQTSSVGKIREKRIIAIDNYYRPIKAECGIMLKIEHDHRDDYQNDVSDFNINHDDEFFNICATSMQKNEKLHKLRVDLNFSEIKIFSQLSEFGKIFHFSVVVSENSEETQDNFMNSRKTKTVFCIFEKPEQGTLALQFFQKQIAIFESLQSFGDNSSEQSQEMPETSEKSEQSQEMPESSEQSQDNSMEITTEGEDPVYTLKDANTNTTTTTKIVEASQYLPLRTLIIRPLTPSVCEDTIYDHFQNPNPRPAPPTTTESEMSEIPPSVPEPEREVLNDLEFQQQKPDIIQIVRDPLLESKSLGYCFCIFKTPELAERARNRLDGSSLKKTKLLVDYCMPPMIINDLDNENDKLDSHPNNSDDNATVSKQEYDKILQDKIELESEKSDLLQKIGIIETDKLILKTEKETRLVELRQKEEKIQDCLKSLQDRDNAIKQLETTARAMKQVYELVESSLQKQEEENAQLKAKAVTEKELYDLNVKRVNEHFEIWIKHLEEKDKEIENMKKSMLEKEKLIQILQKNANGNS